MNLDKKEAEIDISSLSEALLGKLSLYRFGLIGIVLSGCLITTLPGALGT